MCRNPDGSYTIPSTEGEFPVPTDGVALDIIHCSMFHLDNAMLIELIVEAYRDLNGLWLHVRKHMYAENNSEIFTEAQYKDAMNYLVACAVHNDTLDHMVNYVERMKTQEAR